jgi:hypothetical protein
MNRDLGVTVIPVDHNRKNPRPGRRSVPSPTELKGSVAKYGACDFILCLAAATNERRVEVFALSKDADDPLHSNVEVAPKGSMARSCGGSRRWGDWAKTARVKAP